MARLFGTDGVRGLANSELNCELAYSLGQAAVAFLGPNIVIGKDTRLSGDMLESACAAGIMSAGGTALLAGVIPTPGVAFLVRKLACDGGLVISASHNPPQYNGIKLFDNEGFKLQDSYEDEIEAFVSSGGLEASAQNPGGVELCAGDEVGLALPVENACDLYIEHAVSSIKEQGINFSGIHIALDAGHGASSLTSAQAFEQLGARVSVINDDFSGTDINVACGSTHLECLEEFLKETKADIGIAHDGDADRVMLMTPDGSVIDGDFMAASIALDMKARRCLAHNTVVSTVMCNLGFVHAMRDAGIKVIQTSVGDRYVLERMRMEGYKLGGEQSGHMIMLDYNSTGDGLISACQYLAAVLRSGKSFNDHAHIMERFPQKLINVKVADKHALDGNSRIQKALDDASLMLGDNGRVLLRPSGTEPLVRVMVEAASAETANSVAESLATLVQEELASLN